MGNIISGAQGMSQFMDGKVFSSAALGKVVMRKASAPHHFRHRVIIRRILIHFHTVSDHGPQQSFRNTVCHFTLDPRDKIALHGVHHNIRHPACHLVHREGRRQFRIHHRKTAPVERCVDSSLLSDLLIGQHRRITHLASCRRDGQNCRNRKRSCQRHFSGPDIPEFLLRICRAMGDRFCCIDRASASYRQNKVRPKSQRLLYAFLRKRKAWIWFDSAEFFIGDSRLRQRLLHPPDQAAADGASATVNQKHSASSPFLYFLTRLIFCSFSKDYFCWCILYKIFHRFFFLSYLFHFRLKRKSMFKHDNHSTG